MTVWTSRFTDEFLNSEIRLASTRLRMFSIALSTLVEAAVGARGRKRFVEELEQERLWYSGTRGVTVALQQTLPFQLPRIVTELIQAATS